MLLINTSRTDSASTVYGAPSPPHSLSVSSHSATWITVAWQPPEFSHPHETITYRVIHKVANNFTVIDTRLLWVRIANLQPNTQHIIYVVALGAKGTSLPSETLVAWTDPALPAFVDVSTVIKYFNSKLSFYKNKIILQVFKTPFILYHIKYGRILLPEKLSDSFLFLFLNLFWVPQILLFKKIVHLF